MLNKLPKSLQPKAKSALHEIWMAESRHQAQKAFEAFLDTHRDKYPKAAQCLEKDREQQQAFAREVMERLRPRPRADRVAGSLGTLLVYIGGLRSMARGPVLLPRRLGGTEMAGVGRATL